MPNLRDVYNFAFDWALALETQKTLALETALALWHLLFAELEWPLIDQWCKHKTPIKNPRFPYGKREIYQLEKSSIVKPLASRTNLWFGPSLDPAHSEISESIEFSRTEISKKSSNFLVLGAVSVGVVLFLMGFDDNEALAWGPEGPLMEEFWDNMRRYGLYALTVSTGVLWVVFQPIYELLKNPISAILILTIMGASAYIVSQVVSAMVGITDFSYDYNY